SAATTRWRVSRASVDDGASGPGRTAWSLELMRCKAGRAAFGRAGKDEHRWLLEWNGETSTVAVSADMAGGPGAAQMPLARSA
ncbi:MAG: hypothetical protein CMJ18_15575, partial [Phycisphaeraceae bacterium]|nr:hypothetical protein [Phycisphaeraceae bacterium]